MHSMSRVSEGKRQLGEIRHSGEILHSTGGGHLGVCVFVFVCLYFFICVIVYNSAMGDMPYSTRGSIEVSEHTCINSKSKIKFFCLFFRPHATSSTDSIFRVTSFEKIFLLRLLP